MRTRLGIQFPLFCIGLATSAMAQITEVASDGVLNAPYRGGATAWREADMEMAYGEVWNLTIDYIGDDPAGHYTCLTPIAKVEMVDEDLNPIPWDRSLIRVYQGYDASGYELMPDGPPSQRELGTPDGGNYLLWHWKMSIKAVGTRSLTESEQFRFRIRFQSCSLTFCSGGCCSYDPIFGFCLYYCTYTCDCPSNPSCSSFVTLNRHVTIAPTAVAGGVGESHPWYPGNEVLRIRSGTAELAATVGESTKMIGQSFVVDAGTSLYKSREFRLPGAPETVYLQPSTFFAQSSPEKINVGTPWPGHMPGWSAELHDGPDDIWDVRAPDGTIYRYAEPGGPADAPAKLLKYIIPPGLDQTSPATVLYEYAPGLIDGHKYVEKIRDQSHPTNYNYIQLNRDGQGRVTSVSRNGTESWTIGNGANDRIASVTPPGTKGRRYYGYDTDGRLTRIGDHADAEMFTFEYFTSGPNKGQIRFERQRVDDEEQTYAEYQYPADQIKQILKPDTNSANDRVITCAYAGHRLTSASADTYTTGYEWDFDNPRGCVALKKTTLPDGTIIENTYYQSGGNRFPFVEKTEVYKNVGNKLTVFDVTYEYRTGNTYYRYPRMQSSRDGLGAQVTYAYTPGITEFNQLAGIIGPTITSGFSPGTPETRFDYYTDPGPRKNLVYERRVKATDSTWIKTRYEYDDLRRLIRTRLDPDGENIVVELAEEPLRPDGQINLMRDPRDFLTRSLYDSAGRLTQVKRYLAPDVEGPAFYDTTYVYDDNGWVDRVDAPVKDQDGVLIVETGTRRTKYLRDSLGRVVETRLGEADGGAGVYLSGSVRVGHHYNQLGETVKATGMDGLFTSTMYDVRGNVTQVQSGHGAAIGAVGSGSFYAGKTVTYHYDSAGRLESVDHADGRTIDYGQERDDFGRVTRTVELPGGALATFAYDRNNRITLSETYDGQETPERLLARIGNEYDEAQRLFRVSNDAVGTGAAAEVQLRQYRLDGRPLRMLQKGAHPCTGSPNLATGQIGEEPGDFYVDYSYDTAGRLTALSRPSSQVTCPSGVATVATSVFTLDAAGNPLQSDVAGRLHIHEYDALHRVTQHVLPTGSSTGTRYNSLSLPIESWVYDTAARQANGMTYPIAHTLMRYDADGQLTRRIEQDASTAGLPDAITDYIYYDSGDGEGRLQFVLDPDLNVTEFAYNNAEQTRTLIDAANNEFITSADAFGRLSQLRLIEPPTDGGPAEQRSRDWRYQDPNGFETHILRNDDEGAPRFRMLSNGRGAVVGTADRRAVEYAGLRDQNNQLLELNEDTTGLQRRTTQTFTPHGLVSTFKVNPGGGAPDQVTNYFHTADGMLHRVSFPDEAPNSVRLGYDVHGELTSWIDQLDAGFSQITSVDGEYTKEKTVDGRTHLTTYDGLNRLVRAEIREGMVSVNAVDFEYDGLGRLTAEVQSLESSTYATRFTYDAEGNLSTVVYPGGEVMDLAGREPLDGLGRPSAVDFDGLPLCDYEYVGQRIKKTRVYPATGGADPLLELSVEYDEHARPAQRTWLGWISGALGKQIDAFRYIYDAGDYVRRAVSLHPGRSLDIIVDALGRMTGFKKGTADENDRLIAGSEVQEHLRPSSAGIDLLGNLLSTLTRYALPGGGFRVIQSAALAVTQANEVLEILETIDGQAEPVVTLVYDYAGNLIADGEQFYVYDSLRQLTAVYIATNGVSANPNGTFTPALQPEHKLSEMSYDVLGRRVTLEVFPLAATLGRLPAGVEPGKWRYLYANHRVLEVRNADSGVLLKRNFWSEEGLDVLLRVDDYATGGGRGGAPVSFFFTNDALGSPTAAVIHDEPADAARVVERYTYDALGSVFVTEGEATCLNTDVNCDGIVGSEDLVIVRLAFGPAQPGDAEDVCGDAGGSPDGQVDEADLACVRVDLGKGLPSSNPRGADPKPDKTVSLHGLTYDHASGLVFARNRYYSPRLGRWTQRDPLGYADGGSLYEAFGSNPLSHTDPLGLDSIDEEANGDLTYSSDGFIWTFARAVSPTYVLIDHPEWPYAFLMSKDDAKSQFDTWFWETDYKHPFEIMQHATYLTVAAGTQSKIKAVFDKHPATRGWYTPAEAHSDVISSNSRGGERAHQLREIAREGMQRQVGNVAYLTSLAYTVNYSLFTVPCGLGGTVVDLTSAALNVADGQASEADAVVITAAVGGALFHLKFADDIVAGSKIAKSNNLMGDASTGYRVAGGAPVSLDEFVNIYNARTSARITQGVLEKIDPARLSAETRFGKAVYAAELGETAVAEVAYHNAKATHVIRYHLDLRHAKVLDLTDARTASRWGYIASPDNYANSQRIAERARRAGYNVVKFKSLRGEGANYAILGEFERLLSPQMVAPVP